MRDEKKLKILVVDDEPVVRNSLKTWFTEDGHEVGVAACGKDALALVRQSDWDLALIDIKMPGMDGLELQQRLREAAPETSIIVMTAYAAVDTAIEALKAGAFDYVIKPFDPEYLSHLVKSTAERHHLQQENVSLKSRLASVVSPVPILGESAAMRRVRALIDTVAPSDTTVLITGESGTGKELVARAIHAASPRSYMPMVIVNCGALPEGTLESELFGHERGAFTGAQHRHKGKFELADGGTLFLDEIAEVTPRIQVELLRVLEEKCVTRVGGTATVPTDFRTITATNRDLAAYVKRGQFRDDLFYRLNVFEIDVPALRERPEDIPILARAFAERFSEAMSCPVPTFEDDAMETLMEYPWPGNVRELANAVERAMVVRHGATILPDDFPVSVGNGQSGDVHEKSLAAVERRHIEHVLRETDWNIARTARILDINRATVYNKLKQYGLRKECVARR